jgi:tetratricopeptide (TPR) repeat protein
MNTKKTIASPKKDCLTLFLSRFMVVFSFLLSYSSLIDAKGNEIKKAVKPKIKIMVPLTSLTRSCQPMVNKQLKIPKVPIRGLSERTSKRINRALEKMADEKYDEALLLFQKIAKSKDQYVRALTAQYMGSLFAIQGDTKNSMKYFSLALDLGKGYLPHKRIQNLTIQVASMLYGGEKIKDSITLFKRWLKNSNVDNSQVYLLYSSILYRQGKNKAAICPAFWAAKTDKKPNKNAFSLMLQGHLDLKEYKGAEAILLQLIKYFPASKNYWRNLAVIYGQREKMKDALAIMELFYLQGFMEKSSDYKQLSAFFAWNNIPNRSAYFLKKGIEKKQVKSDEKNWKNIAQNYHLARELKKASYAYEQAGQYAKTGENELKQAEILIENEQYQQSIHPLNKALKKGVKDPGKLFFQKGIAYLELKQFNNAKKALKQAKKYKKWRSRAINYTKYVKGQKKVALQIAQINHE